MSTQLKNVVFAIFCGSFFGALIALEMQPYLWWVGVMIGGLIGRFTYEPLVLFRATREAWKQACVALPVEGRKFLAEVPRYARIFSLAFRAAASITASLVIITAAAHLLVSSYEQRQADLTIVVIMIISVFVFVLALFFIDGIEKKTKLEVKVFEEIMRNVYKQGNPLSLVFIWLPLAIWDTLSFVLRAVFTSMKFCSIFCKKLFLLIHSEMSLLCIVDAAIGAAIGYFLGNHLLGTCIGVAWGFMNHQLISKRLLKLVH